jgi:hypothetical protein
MHRQFRPIIVWPWQWSSVEWFCNLLPPLAIRRIFLFSSPWNFKSSVVLWIIGRKCKQNVVIINSKEWNRRLSKNNH